MVLSLLHHFLCWCALHVMCHMIMLYPDTTISAAGSLLLAKAACQLLVRAVQQGLPNLTRHLMVVVMKENVGLLGQVRGLKGMGLLHLAVKAGSCAVVAALLQPTAAAPVWQVRLICFADACMALLPCCLDGRWD